MGSSKYDTEIKAAVEKWWPDLPAWRLWKAQLIQESGLDPNARSNVGAAGLAQFMPASWGDMVKALRFPDGVSPTEAKYAIEAGAYYQGKLRRSWKPEGRTTLQRHDLGLASYNAGMGSILKAQERCGGPRLWEEIAPCLDRVTGPENARQTTDYVVKIRKWWQLQELGQ